MKKNIQIIEKSISSENGVCEVHSIFYTIQGEGPFSGVPAVFIRLAGCNLQCPGCDTDYTSTRTQMSPKDILAKVDALTTMGNLVVITGGEPFRQNIAGLIRTLANDGYQVQIETNGTLAPPMTINWGSEAHIICSPKTGKINPVIETLAMAFKYVLHAESIDPEDGLPVFALGHSAKPRVSRPPENKLVYVQPMDCKDSFQNKKNEEAAIASCMKYGYIFQVQLHKIIGLE